MSGNNELREATILASPLSFPDSEHLVGHHPLFIFVRYFASEVSGTFSKQGEIKSQFIKRHKSWKKTNHHIKEA